MRRSARTESEAVRKQGLTWCHKLRLEIRAWIITFFYRVTGSHQNSWFWRERLKGATNAFHLAFWSDLVMQRKWFSSVDNIQQTCKFEHAVWVMQARFSLFVQMKLFLTKTQVAAVRLKATPTRCQETKNRTLRTLSSSTISQTYTWNTHKHVWCLAREGKEKKTWIPLLTDWQTSVWSHASLCHVRPRAKQKKHNWWGKNESPSIGLQEYSRCISFSLC